MSTCGCHEAPAWFISFVCHRSPLGICPCRETESYLLTHSTNVYEYLQCCNYCARHRLKDKLKAIRMVLRATTRTLQHEAERQGELLEKREKAVQGTREVTSGKRKGGQVERKTESASWRRQHLNWSSRREDCNRTGVSIPSGGWSGAFSLPLTSCSLCRDNHISLLY